MEVAQGVRDRSGYNSIPAILLQSGMIRDKIIGEHPAYVGVEIANSVDLSDTSKWRFYIDEYIQDRRYDIELSEGEVRSPYHKDMEWFQFTDVVLIIIHKLGYEGAVRESDVETVYEKVMVILDAMLSEGLLREEYVGDVWNDMCRYYLTDSGKEKYPMVTLTKEEGKSVGLSIGLLIQKRGAAINSNDIDYSKPPTN